MTCSMGSVRMPPRVSLYLKARLPRQRSDPLVHTIILVIAFDRCAAGAKPPSIDPSVLNCVAQLGEEPDSDDALYRS